MELTKKQLILIAAISGAILLLTVAAILLSTAGDGEASVAPTALNSVKITSVEMV